MALVRGSAGRRRRAAVVFAVALPLADLSGFCATAGYAQTTFRHFAERGLEGKLAAAKLKSAIAACPGGIPVRGRGCYRLGSTRAHDTLDMRRDVEVSRHK